MAEEYDVKAIMSVLKEKGEIDTLIVLLGALG